MLYDDRQQPLSDESKGFLLGAFNIEWTVLSGHIGTSHNRGFSFWKPTTVRRDRGGKQADSS